MGFHITILLVAGAAVRLFVWIGHGATVFADRTLDRTWLADCRNLLSDPGFALAWDYARPPLFAIREIAKCASIDLIAPWHFNMLLVSALDVAAAALAYLTLRLLAVGGRTALAAALVWSIGLIAWEYYRFGGNHNHVVVFLVTLSVFTAVRRWRRSGFGNDLAFAASGALLVSAYGAGLILIPLLALLGTPWPAGARRATASLVLAISLPALTYLGIGLKNQGHIGVFSTSGYLSVNLAQYGFISLGYDRQGDKLISLLPAINGSPWWHWCIDRQRSGTTEPKRLLMGLHGQCLDYTDANDVQLGLDAAKRLGDARFTESLTQDLNVTAERPWAIRYTGAELATKTEALQNEISKRLYSVVLKTEPLKVLRTFLMANRSFFIWGPLMFDGVHHEPHLAVAPRYVNWLATGVGVFKVVSVVAWAVFTIALALRLAAAWRRGLSPPFGTTIRSIWFGLGLMMAFVIAGTIMNGVSCCENGRQFQSMGVIPFLTGVVFTVNLVKRRLGQRP